MSVNCIGISRVVVVSRHALVGELLAASLSRHDDFQSVGAAGTVKQAVALCLERRPDVVVMDYQLPDASGLDAAEQILAQLPDARIILLADGLSAEELHRVVETGVSGLLPLDAPLDSLLEALRHACPTAMAVHPCFLIPSIGPEGVTFDGPPLTRRELQVLGLLADGSDARAAARNLEISLNTCRGYIKAVLAKLGAHSQLEAVATARQLRLIA
ncbi:putative two-component system response regulator [Arthrobacter crystallopoietes BAB-32]|uniref:Putative two-component system response regulator n=1 Tax=Arthrobacter crystallopoietes BAB-32 TaxID=1246476 RepID=N1V0F4_9MICC|nr:response regulator transcription factor [Arthrobacter crystallopoietes]EMY36136.1 putative two-component system response regulator [Arthrobacter crystallopoietes BAB-32]